MLDRPARLILADALFDCESGEIVRHGKRTRVTPKAARTLAVLCEQPGEVVSKDRIIELVWGGSFVTDHVIWHGIAELRSALGDDARDPHVIETLPKRGYRLLVPAVPAIDDGDPKGRGGRDVPHGRGRVWAAAAALLVLAVATAVGLTRSAGEAGLTAGAPLPAGDAGPAAEGAPAAADALLVSAEDAYARYTGGYNERAIELFEAVVDLEPDNARAQAGLANAYAQKAMYHSRESWWSSLALETASRAVALAPESGDAHKALGLALASQKRLAAAAQAYRLALELSPGHLGAINNLALTETARGNLAEAARLLQDARRLDPGDAVIANHLGTTYRLLGMKREARAALEDAARSGLDSLATANVWQLALLDVAEGGLAPARRRVQAAAQHLRRSFQLWVHAGDLELAARDDERARDFYRRALPSPAGWDARAALSWMRVGGDVGQPPERLMGDLLAMEPEAWHRELHEPALAFAAVHAALGETVEAMRWLTTAVDRGYRDRVWLAVDPLFDALHGEPGFAALLQRVDRLVGVERAALPLLEDTP